MALSIGRTIQALSQRVISNQLKQTIIVPRAQFPSPMIRFYSADIASKEEIDKLVKKNKVVLFMKGVPDEPKCGFSNAVTQILRMHGVTYDSHDVLANDAIRQGIKDYTNWPTIPQLFINGEFVGGCDILLTMHQNGELIQELKKVDITSAVLKEAQDKKNDDTKKE